VSVALFELGQRLRAAALRRPVARCAFTPVLPPVDPVAVTVEGTDERVLVRAADASGVTTGHGATALSALTDLAVSPEAEPRTLVVASRVALSRLVDLAVQTEPESACAATAAVVSWWAQRADHPGTSVVVDVVSACAERWVLGLPPAAEREVVVWRDWLGVADRGPRGLLALAAAVSSGPSLPGLESIAEDDRSSWEAFVARVTDPKSPWDWRRRDSRREAALGLATRCDTTELYESLRLGDPLVAVRELFEGTVVTGRVTAVPSRMSVEVTLDQLACRLRESAAVEGFPGFPQDLPPAGSSAIIRGRVAETRVSPRERLVVIIEDAIIRANSVRVGQRITLRPRSVDPRQQRSGRHELHRRYAARRSWLSGGPAPSPRRRDVPLDVVISAAE
jgi:hypothetical protein